ncbi:MAG: efflux transporter outer membrane subunit, partial [Gemmatimonadetes bacterium]|nr:efflux transporter outer membrane subunit [Gemmatimonadota bacterium]
LSPAVELPDGWSTEAESRMDGAWWASFPDPALPELLDEALANNWNLAAAGARLEAAAAEAKIAGADVWPALNLTGNAARQEQVLTFLKDPVTGAPLKNVSNSFGVSLGVSWELDLWGRVRNGKSAAAADLQAATADYAAARQSIAAQTMKAWFAALEAQEQAALAQETVASFERTVERIRSRYERGLQPSLDVRLGLVDLADARTVAAARQVARDRAVRQLEILLGRYPAGRLEAAGSLPDPPADVPAGLPAELLSRRPDLVAAERRLAASLRRNASARRALLPRLTLTGSAGRSSSELGDLLAGDFSVWSIAGGLLQPIFQGGRLRAQVSRSGALADAALATWANSVLTACAEIETLLASESFLRVQETEQRIRAEEAAAAHAQARRRYERGLTDVNTLLSSQRSAAQARSAWLDARRQRLDARVDLHLALGGDFGEARPSGGSAS